MTINYRKQSRKIEKLQDRITTLEKNNCALQSELASWMNLKHEAAKLNSSILSLSEELNSIISNLNENSKKEIIELKKISDLSTTIIHTASIIDSRIVYSDLELNSSLINKQPRFTSTLYKKFDKARYVLYKTANEKKIKIDFKNNSSYSIQAIKAFDCVPFIILDNAIKYSPRNNFIEVQFNEGQHDLEIIISSIGPKVEKENLPKLLDRGFRAPNTEKLGVAGEGLGLYIANQLCKLHDIKLIANSDYTKGINNINGIEYCTFTITLKMEKVISE